MQSDGQIWTDGKQCFFPLYIMVGVQVIVQYVCQSDGIIRCEWIDYCAAELLLKLGYELLYDRLSCIWLMLLREDDVCSDKLLLTVCCVRRRLWSMVLPLVLVGVMLAGLASLPTWSHCHHRQQPRGTHRTISRRQWSLVKRWESASEWLVAIKEC